MLDQQCVAHTFIKAGVYYYTRRVPKGVRHHYACKLISFSLRTKLAKIAAKRAEQMSAKYEQVWFQLSLGNKAEHKGIVDNAADVDVPKLSQALACNLTVLFDARFHLNLHPAAQVQIFLTINQHWRCFALGE